MTVPVGGPSVGLGQVLVGGLGPALFALAGVAFLLPGATLSDCAGSTTVTGWELATHTTPRISSFHGFCTNDYAGLLSGSWAYIATATLVLTAFGFALAVAQLKFARIRAGPIFLCAWAALFAMVVASLSSLDIWGPVVEPRSGAWVAFSALAASASWYGVRSLWYGVRSLRHPSTPEGDPGNTANARAGTAP